MALSDAEIPNGLASQPWGRCQDGPAEWGWLLAAFTR